jgi:hypothetical protein
MPAQARSVWSARHSSSMEPWASAPRRKGVEAQRFPERQGFNPDETAAQRCWPQSPARPGGFAISRRCDICSVHTAHRAAKPQPTREAPRLAPRTRMQTVRLPLRSQPRHRCPPRSSIFPNRSQADRQTECRARKRPRAGGAASPVHCPGQVSQAVSPPCDHRVR